MLGARHESRRVDHARQIRSGSCLLARSDETNSNTTTRRMRVRIAPTRPGGNAHRHQLGRLVAPQSEKVVISVCHFGYVSLTVWARRRGTVLASRSRPAISLFPSI